MKHTTLLSPVISICTLLLMVVGAAAQLTPENLRCEDMKDPAGIDLRQPRFSWALKPDKPDVRNQSQSAVQILVASSKAKLDAHQGDVWNSGRIDTDEQALLLPATATLTSGRTYYWKARAYDQANQVSSWSKPALWITGLLDSSDWNGAKWIGQSERIDVNDKKSGPTKKTHWFRKSIQLDAVPPAATVHVGSFGYHELYVNGQRVGDTVLDPAVSRLTKRIYYRTYDISSLLRKGPNTIAIWLGQGWAGWPNWSTYGMELNSPIKHGPAIIAVVRDNTQNIALTDTSWKTAPANLSANAQWFWASFGGEKLDLTAAVPNWNAPGFNDAAWANASLVETEPVKLSAHLVQPNRIIRQIKPVSVEPVPDKENTWRIDFGQNYNGWVRLPLVGPAGTKVTLQYSERYNPKKPRTNLASFGQIDHVVLSGDPKLDIFENRFNYHQFRWLTIGGLPAAPDLSQIIGLQIRTDYTPASTFASSNPILDKIHALALHTYESLTLGGYIVDCSHRERGGYGAEGQASMETGLYNYDQAALLRKWAGDWGDMLQPNGDLPHCAPTYWGGGGPAWKMASVNIPWGTYVHSGDTRILSENYETMTKHCEFILQQIKGDKEKVFPGFGGSVWNNIGDWYSATNVDPPKNQKLNGPLILTRQFFANCFVVHTFDNMSRAAAALCKTEDAKLYAERAATLRTNTHKKFYNAEGNFYARNEQTYLAFALFANIPPPEIRPLIEAALEKDIRETRNGHISSGVLGTYIQLKLLTQTGRSDLVHLMATQPGIPGWVNFIDRGDTTMPEVWDPERAPHYGQSLAHTSYISIGSWFIEGLAGIRVDPGKPGFKHFFIQPGATQQVEWVKASHTSTRGNIAVQWKNDPQTTIFTLEATIPPNTTATVFIPTKDATSITESGTKPISLKPTKNGATIEIGSGHYTFKAAALPTLNPKP
ncbi:MAG: glycoside hydrolase family 78 protein [Puniceicoccales bacterium]|nr:glycoside hydrolase family 78 protein [Puniceicoccales bacterium]